MTKFKVVYFLCGTTRNDDRHMFGRFKTYEAAEHYLLNSDDPYLTWSNDLWIEKHYIRTKDTENES